MQLFIIPGIFRPMLSNHDAKISQHLFLTKANTTITEGWYKHKKDCWIQVDVTEEYIRASALGSNAKSVVYIQG